MTTRWIDAETVRAALESLLAHRLRATLSAIGIVTGVSTVVASLAIAGGAERQAIGEIGLLGVDNIIVRSSVAGGDEGQRAPVLVDDDARAIGGRLPSATVAVLRVVADTARVGNRTIQATVAGVSPEWRLTAGLTVARGRWIDAGDEVRRTAVLGGELASTLFRAEDPIGQRVEAAGEWRTVIGVLPAAEGPGTRGAASAVQAIDVGRTVFVPVSSLDLSLGAGDAGDAVSQIVARVAPGGDVVGGAAAVTALLSERHERDQRAYEVVVPQELLRARLRTERRFHLLLLSIGGLALLVSGVGIMNIMVASVTERAVEIGIRRAFGARKRVILAQFAAEAGIMSGAAGLAGVPIGLAGAFIVAWMAGWPVAVTATSVVVSLGLAVGVGLAAAIYPAHLAAEMSPTEALQS